MALGSLLGFVTGPFGALAATGLSALLGAKAAKQKRKQTISDQDKQFVRMRDAAEKAGFNPLTVMRSGGAQMFGGVPTFSKAAFMQDFVQKGYNAFVTHPDNDPLKKYNDEVRKLTLQGMKSQISLDKSIIRSAGAISRTTLGSVTGKGTNPATDERTAVTTPFGTSSPANTSDAEVYEQRYGEIVSEIAGISNLIGDAYNSGVNALQEYLSENTLGFNKTKRADQVKQSTLFKDQIKTTKLPPLSTKNFGPNYRDRMGFRAGHYNY
jgi:hypothetical protein